MLPTCDKMTRKVLRKDLVMRFELWFIVGKKTKISLGSLERENQDRFNAKL